MPKTKAHLLIQNLSLYKSGNLVLNKIHCDLPVGEIVALLGPSGSGKTTLLRSIARLEEVPSGFIFFKDKDIHALLPTEIGMVFQNFNLFPHMTVFENLCFSPKQLNQTSFTEIEQKAQSLLEDFGLGDKGDSYITQLSGGQKQRVAIARALMLDPEIILFDEPTSALDPEMVTEVAEIIAKLKAPHRLIVMATHELTICELIADRILFLDNGEVVDFQPKTAFFKAPKSERAKIFLKNHAK